MEMCAWQRGTGFTCPQVRRSCEHPQEKFQQASRFLRHWSLGGVFVPWEERGTLCSVARAASQLPAALRAVEGISNAAGRLDVQRGCACQLTGHRQPVPHWGSTERALESSYTTTRNQGADLQLPSSAAHSALGRETSLHAPTAGTCAFPTARCLYLAFGSFPPPPRKAKTCEVKLYLWISEWKQQTCC